MLVLYCLVENDLKSSNLKQHAIIAQCLPARDLGTLAGELLKQAHGSAATMPGRGSVPGGWQNPVACICVASFLSVALKSHS